MSTPLPLPVDEVTPRSMYEVEEVLRIAAAMPGATVPLDAHTVRVMTAFAKVAQRHQAALTALARL